MKSPMEVLVGRARDEWRARDRWVLRVCLGGLGFVSFLFLRFVLVLLHGPYGAPLAAPFHLWAFLNSVCLVVLAERRIRPTPAPSK